MSLIDVTPTRRIPGPFAGQVRQCMHKANGIQCQTRLNQYDAGPYCYCHAPLYLDEPNPNLKLAA
jgi:hypothetical protein